MAGLTKEQRAERAAQRAAEAHEVDAGLVEMVKAGEVARVHPTTVKSHQAAGWKLKD
jgi:hypothetical protein